MGARLKTINADEAAYEGFRQLAKECELTSPELVSAMVQYFRVTKADPREPTGPDLTTSLAKLTAKLADLDKRTIGFIREQEKTYLKPILAQVQAHQVLSVPAVSAPAGLNEGQVQELSEWFMRLLRGTMQPIVLAQAYLNATLPPPPAQGQHDLALNPIKKQVLAVMRTAFKPEVMIPAKLSSPPAPTVAPILSPAQPA
jgi:hypothetical protein